MNILPGTVIGVFTLFIYAAIISLRTDLFLFCFPEQSNKERVLIYPGPSYDFFPVNIRSHKGRRVQVEREVGTIFIKNGWKACFASRVMQLCHQDILLV